MEKGRKGNQHDQNKKETPLLEWAVAALGLIFVLGSIGSMIYHGLRGDRLPPEITFQIDAIRPVENSYLVQFRAMNRGDFTMEGLKVIGELHEGDREIEKSETLFDYLPAHSEGKGGFFFRQDPKRFELRLYAEGYEEP